MFGDGPEKEAKIVGEDQYMRSLVYHTKKENLYVDDKESLS